jgi:RNA polymerase sigma-70 factor, ECF subfamily
MSRILERGVVHPLEQELEISFREHYQMLYRTAYGILKNQADAEDVPQKIFLRLLRSGVPADFTANARRYLYRAAVNLSLDVIRTQKRQNLTSGVEKLEVPVEASEASLDEQIHKRLAEAIAELRPEDAELLMMRYVHGLKEKDLASLTGSTRGSIAIKLFRARARLKRIMRDLAGGEK